MDKMNEQRSDLWGAERLGRFTASEIWKLMKDGRKSGEMSETAKTYIMDKVAEELTGERPEINTWSISWGIENEPLAKKWFKKLTGFTLEDTGFHAYGDHAGGSPDGLVNDDAILEIKCPAVSTNHVKHLLINSPEYFKANFPEYYYQMQACMLFTGRNRGYFVSFDPRVDSEFGFYLIEIPYNAGDGSEILLRIESAANYKNQILNTVKQAKEIAA